MNRLSAILVPSVLLVVLAAAPMARAGGPQEDAAKQEYALGWQALQEGKFAQALEHYRRSYELTPRPRTLFNIAVTEEKLGLLRDALIHFSEFLEQAEARDRELVKLARERLDELEKRVPGRLEITSTPPGADVYVDDGEAARGRTPLTLELTAGSHRLKVLAPGAKPMSRSVKVDAGRSREERFELSISAPAVDAAEPEEVESRRAADAGAARRGTLVIHSRVAGATVSVDGLVVGTTSLASASKSRTPVLRHQAAWGAHTIIVERPGGRTWRKQLHVSPDETVTIDLAFQGPRPGRKRLITWGLAGLGVVSLAAGGTLGVLALQDVTQPTPDEHSRGKTRARLSDLLFAGGTAAILGAWWLERTPATSVKIRRSHTGE